MAQATRISKTPGIDKYNKTYHSEYNVKDMAEGQSTKDCETMASPCQETTPLRKMYDFPKNSATVRLDDVQEVEDNDKAKNWRKSMKLSNMKSMKSTGHKPSRKTRAAHYEKMTTYTTPAKYGTRSTFSATIKPEEKKVSKLCMSAHEPFRKTQTRITKSIKETVSEHETWEDAMDKNFDNVTFMVREKKLKKEENLNCRHYMGELLDEIDMLTNERNAMNKEKEKTQKHNSDLTKENRLLEDELKHLNDIINREKNKRGNDNEKLEDTKHHHQYIVDKLQRELDEKREKWTEILIYKQGQHIELLNTQLADAEQECVSLEHESRNTVLRLNKQAKRLKEKNQAISQMVDDQDKICTTKGKVVIRNVSKDPEMEYFSQRLKKIVHS